MRLIGSVDDNLVHETEVTNFFAAYYIMALCHSDSVSVLILSLFSLILLFLADKTHQKGIEFNSLQFSSILIILKFILTHRTDSMRKTESVSQRISMDGSSSHSKSQRENVHLR